jgi:predicted metalloprotease
MKIALPRRRSSNLEDRRGAAGPSLGGGMPLPLPLPLGMLGGLGLPGLLLTLVLFVVVPMCTGGSGGFGLDTTLPRVQAPSPGAGGGIPAEADADADLVSFASFVLDDVQTLWASEFAESGQQYDDARLVLFEDAVQSGCGVASSATGPFYCPLDETAYLDLSFFRELQSRFDAPGDFAQAYVIAHEIAHHVQNLTGISDEVRRLQQRNPDDANELSVRLELQADCFAGVWGHSTYERGILESGDLEEGLTAAAAIGDDRIQEQATGRTNPETWTHGSSDQRVKWFRRGFDSGDSNRCDTFAGDV